MTELSATDPTPRRIQRRRAKGWRLPAGAICVDRSTKLGNPFWIDEQAQQLTYTDRDGYVVTGGPTCTRAELIAVHAAWVQRQPIPWPKGVTLHGNLPEPPPREAIRALRGHHLACYCPPTLACHADILLKLANEPEEPDGTDDGRPAPDGTPREGSA